MLTIPNTTQISDADSPETWERIGIQYAEHKDWINAREAYQKGIAASASPPARILAKLGIAEWQLGNLLGAEEAFRRGLSANPTHLRCAERLLTLLNSTGREHEAIVAVNDLLEKTPGESTFWGALATAQRHLGYYEEAEKSYIQVLNLGGYSKGILFQLANMAANRKLFGRAEKYLTDLLQKYPDDLDAKKLLAQILKGNDTYRAINILRDAAQIHPNDITLWLELAKIMFNNEKIEEACSAISTALALDTKNVGAFLLGAQINTTKGNWDKVKEYYLAAFTMQAPDPKQAERFIDACLEHGDYGAIDDALINPILKNGLVAESSYSLTDKEYLYGDISVDPMHYFWSFTRLHINSLITLRNCAVGLADFSSEYYTIRNGKRITTDVPIYFDNTIHLFGDSVTFGAYNSRDDLTISSHLQKFLNQGSFSRRFRAVNHGIGGQGEDNHYLQLLRENEIAPGDYVFELLVRDPKESVWNDDVFLRRAEIFEQMRLLCQQRGALFKLVFLPSPFFLVNPSDREKAIVEYWKYRIPGSSNLVQSHEQFTNVIKSLSCEYMDLFSLAERPHDMGEVFNDRVHFNHRLNAKVAQAIFDDVLPDLQREERKKPVLIRAFQWVDSSMKKVARALFNDAPPAEASFPEESAEEKKKRVLTRAFQWVDKSVKRTYQSRLDIGRWIEQVRNPAFEGQKRIGALVMNCNPFTNGHLFLVETAVFRIDSLYIFVVENDTSEYSFEDRIALVRQGTRHLGGKVHVMPSGDFIISNLTFPEYFAKASATTPGDSSADVFMFASIIAPQLGITDLFVGDEPNCMVTNAYNEARQFVFPHFGIGFHVIKRKEMEGLPISASSVRKAIHAEDWETVRALVPEHTYAFLRNSCPSARNSARL